MVNDSSLAQLFDAKAKKDIRNKDHSYTITNSIIPSYRHKHFQLNTFRKHKVDLYCIKTTEYLSHALLVRLVMQFTISLHKKKFEKFSSCMQVYKCIYSNPIMIPKFYQNILNTIGYKTS